MFGAQPASGPGIQLRALLEGHVLQAIGSADCNDLPKLLATIGDQGDFAVRSAGPRQWLVVGDASLTSDAIEARANQLGKQAVLVDQSHGRVRISLAGIAVETLLAKGTGIDLGLPAFPVGHSAMTLIRHIAAHLTRVGACVFEILVARGFAESLWDDLLLMGGEFGVEAKVAG